MCRVRVWRSMPLSVVLPRLYELLAVAVDILPECLAYPNLQLFSALTRNAGPYLDACCQLVTAHFPLANRSLALAATRCPLSSL